MKHLYICAKTPPAGNYEFLTYFFLVAHH